MRRSARSSKRLFSADYVSGDGMGLSDDSASENEDGKGEGFVPRKRTNAAADDDYDDDDDDFAPAGMIEASARAPRRPRGAAAGVSFARERERLKSKVAASRARAAAARRESGSGAGGVPIVEVLPLGAGCEVGRSCILVTIGSYTVMLDCGVHLGHRDERRFPDWRAVIDPADVACVVVTHYHLDHCGALPMWSERSGYDGPIFATKPTRDMLPVLLHDYRGLMGHGAADAAYTAEEVDACVRKVVGLELHQVVRCPARRRRPERRQEEGEGDGASEEANDGTEEEMIEIKTYYAGHTLGAAMFLITVGQVSVLYTGDFTMEANHVLRAAFVDACRPTLLISESTLACMVHEVPRRALERQLLASVRSAVARGGKVLLPSLAVGRAHELSSLIQGDFRRGGLRGSSQMQQNSSSSSSSSSAQTPQTPPVYYSSAMTGAANSVYRKHASWTLEGGEGDPFHATRFRRLPEAWARRPALSATRATGSCVLFASPAQLQGGASFEFFKAWCGDAVNLIVLTGYYGAGSIGKQLQLGSRRVAIPGAPVGAPHSTLEVKCEVLDLPLSDHADSVAILRLVHGCQPEAVLLVHGTAVKMRKLRKRIASEIGVRCFCPANGELVAVDGDLEMIETELTKAVAVAKAKGAPGAAAAARRRLKAKPLHELSLRDRVLSRAKQRRRVDARGGVGEKNADELFASLLAAI